MCDFHYIIQIHYQQPQFCQHKVKSLNPLGYLKIGKMKNAHALRVIEVYLSELLA